MLRAWVPGCSTGEEAYSLAIVFKEALAQVQAGPEASRSRSSPPTSTRTPSTGRAQGVYPANIAGDVSAERLRRFFVQEEHGYRVGKEIREMVVFAPQNVIMDPPFTKLDILSCRNLLIYLEPELQKKLLPLFHYSLNPGGILFLGSAETVGAVRRPLRPAGRQDAALPAARCRPGGRAGRVPRLVRPDLPAGRERCSRHGSGCPSPTSRRSRTSCCSQRYSPGGRADERQGRHPLHQRADGQVPGAGGRQGQLEHLRHGPRGAARRAGQRLPEGAAQRSAAVA